MLHTEPAAGPTVAPGEPGQVCWTISRHDRMRVPVRLYGDRATRAEVLAGDTLPQLVNVASLPGVVGAVIALPEVQPGGGFPVGAVAAFDPRAGGVVIPGGIGYDINCGVRLLRSELPADALLPVLGELLDDLLRRVVYAPVRPALSELAGVLAHGAGWAIAHGCGIPADADLLDGRGALPHADARLLSGRALARGAAQLGTLGSGSHFIEIGSLDEIFDPGAAAALSLARGQTTVLIHSGSRGLGCQVCADAVEAMLRAAERYRIQLGDRQLACAPLASDEGRRFLAAMAAAANYGHANRQVLTHRVRQALGRTLGLPLPGVGLAVLCDVPHNLATCETHVVGGEELRLCVHRRGACRALPPGHPDLPVATRHLGQPVVVPGDMGRYSLLVLPGPDAPASFHSLPHGAGRRVRRAPAPADRPELYCAEGQAASGIEVRSASPETLAECGSSAYRDLADIASTMLAAGLARPVALLRPIGVIRG